MYCKNDGVDNVSYTTAHLHRITYEDVLLAVKKLKHNKHDGTCEMSSDHLLFPCDTLYHLISLLFTCMLTHGTCPQKMLHGVMTPLPKNERYKLFR